MQIQAITTSYLTSLGRSIAAAEVLSTTNQKTRCVALKTILRIAAIFLAVVALAAAVTVDPTYAVLALPAVLAALYNRKAAPSEPQQSVKVKPKPVRAKAEVKKQPQVQKLTDSEYAVLNMLAHVPSLHDAIGQLPDLSKAVSSFSGGLKSKPALLNGKSSPEKMLGSIMAKLDPDKAPFLTILNVPSGPAESTNSREWKISIDLQPKSPRAFSFLFHQYFKAEERARYFIKDLQEFFVEIKGKKPDTPFTVPDAFKVQDAYGARGARGGPFVCDAFFASREGNTCVYMRRLNKWFRFQGAQGGLVPDKQISRALQSSTLCHFTRIPERLVPRASAIQVHRSPMQRLKS